MSKLNIYNDFRFDDDFGDFWHQIGLSKENDK